ncbi:hypothetical protein LSH36_639g02002 [Paralvinella palmiformis]|uniref:F5/8 type C domain-containing protein n=1 Tax=Paralvinella palmiformis TaxID=53620 RepID=A0AAD9J432_9ANNE|nr:hypothetical protein LSH36_639g02002 [Paralvinella palmiformis]
MSSYPVFGQRTYMRTCECEYVSNGKCAYTLLLPIGDTAAICDSGPGSSDSGTTPRDLSWIESQLADIQLNVTILKEWNGSQSRLLSQLQSVIINLQSMTASSGLSASPDGLQSETGNSSLDLTQIKRLTENLGNNIQALTEAQKAASRDISSLNVVLTDTVKRMRSVQEELPKLRTQITDNQEDIVSIKTQIQNIRKRMCLKRGLLVSGNEVSIPDSNITASSKFNELHGPFRVRINNTATPGAWCPKEPNSNYEWIQFDFGEDKLLLGTVSKGRYDFEQWVTSYRVEYAVAEQPSGWKHIADVMGEDEIFPGNHDKNSIQVNIFWKPIRAQLIRIIPIDKYNNVNKCMRADVIGCLDDES